MVALLLFCVVDSLSNGVCALGGQSVQAWVISNGVCALGGQSAQAWVAVDVVEPIFVLLC